LSITIGPPLVDRKNRLVCIFVSKVHKFGYEDLIFEDWIYIHKLKTDTKNWNIEDWKLFNLMRIQLNWTKEKYGAWADDIEPFRLY